MKALILLLLFILIACSTQPIDKDENKFPFVHEKVKPLVKKFNKLYKKYRHSTLEDTLVVEFKKIPQSKKARGVYFRVWDYTIISSVHWRKITDSQKEILVFHELGHHILKRGHDWSKHRIKKDGCARSIMYYQGVTDECYLKNKYYYIKELFQWSR